MKIGVLGLGFMGSTHLKAWRKIAGAEVMAVMDFDPQRLSGDLSGVMGNLGTGGERMDFSAMRRYAAPAEIIADPQVEAVDICLPTYLHAPLAIDALRAGKHVVVEKPMALNGAEADRMLEAASNSGRVLMTAQVLRFHPAYEALFRLAADGLGQIRYAFFRRRCAAPAWGPWELDASKSGGGVFDLLIHDIDACLRVFGPPEAVSATGYENLRGGIDTLTARLQYASLGDVIITGGWHQTGAYPFSMEYTVVGDNAVLEFSSAGRPTTLYRADGSSECLEGPEVDWYHAELEYFHTCCVAGASPERCSPISSAAAVKLAQAMLESRACKGRPVTIPAVA